MKILLDTCALLWWTLDPKKLSHDSLETLNQQEKIWVSSISVWEIGLKIKNQKLDIGMPIETYSQHLKELQSLEILPVDTAIWLKNLALDWEHRDPADRTIVATARSLRCALATSDQLMLKYYPKIFQL